MPFRTLKIKKRCYQSIFFSVINKQFDDDRQLYTVMSVNH